LGHPKGRKLGKQAASKSFNVGSHPVFKPTTGLCILFKAGGKPRSLVGDGAILSASTRARRVLTSLNQNRQTIGPKVCERKAEEVVSSVRTFGPKVCERKAEEVASSVRMVGDRDGRGRDGRMCAGAYGLYRCDRGVAGAGRS